MNYKSTKKIIKDVKVKNKKTKKLIIEQINQFNFKNTDGLSFEVNGYIFIIVKYIKKKSLFHNILHHEISHGVFSSARLIGIEHSQGSEEYFTYLTGFVTQEIHKKLKY